MRIAAAALALGLTATPALPMDFTNPDDVRPILAATAGSWVSLRGWEGHDVLYFTHLMTYRCALAEVRYGLNGAAPDTVWEQEPCYTDEAVPFAIKSTEHPPHTPLDAHALGSIEQVTVEITYPDGTTERHAYDRAAILQ